MALRVGTARFRGMVKMRATIALDKRSRTNK